MMQPVMNVFSAVTITAALYLGGVMCPCELVPIPCELGLELRSALAREFVLLAHPLGSGSALSVQQNLTDGWEVELAVLFDRSLSLGYDLEHDLF
jgi:hypothetical protein